MKSAKVILTIALVCPLMLACGGNTNSNANANKTTSTTTTTNTNNANTASKANSSSETSTSPGSTEAGATHYTHKEGGIQFDLPDGWKAEPNGDQMTLSTADGSLSVLIYVSSEENFKEATEALDKELGKVIKNVKAGGEPQETNVGGMQAVSQSGTGEVSGTEIQWAVDLIQAKKPVIVLSFAAPGVWEKHQGEYQQFAKSIKPA